VAGLGLVALAGGDLDAARQRFLEALPLCDTTVYGDWLASLVRTWLGTVSLLQGDPATALDHARLGLAAARRRGDRLATYIGLFTVAQVGLARGDHEDARAALEEGVRLSEQTGDVANLAYFLEALAVLEGGEREAHRVAVLLGAAQVLRETVGANVYGYYKPDEELRARTAEAARQALGAEAYEDTVDAGRSLTPEQAVAYALRDGMSPDEALAAGA
jgi:tetratricopeptide (TPR) repeat protein